MDSAKAEVAAMLTTLPDDGSLEDIQYHLYVLEKVKRGIERAVTEGNFSHQHANGSSTATAPSTGSKLNAFS